MELTSSFSQAAPLNTSGNLMKRDSLVLKRTENTTELEVEQTFKREREWLLTSEIATTCKDLRTVIEQLSQLLQPPSEAALKKKKQPTTPTSQPQSSPLPAEPSTILSLNLDSGDGNLRGFTRMDGWALVDLDLSLKTAKWGPKSTNLVKTAISSPNFMKLHQLENVAHFMRVASEHLENLEKMILSPPTHSAFHDFNTVQRSLNIILQLIHQANDEMDPKSKVNESFPHRCPSNSNAVLQPELPSDVVLDVAISHGDLKMTVYYITPLQTSNNNGKVIDYVENPQVGQQTKYKLAINHTYYGEVLDITTVTVPVQKFQKVTDLLHYCFKVLSDLKDKMSLFL